MIKKKIAFVISSNEIGNWSGGIYFRNLFEIIKSEKNIRLLFIQTQKISLKNKN